MSATTPSTSSPPRPLPLPAWKSAPSSITTAWFGVIGLVATAVVVLAAAAAVLV